MHCKNVTWFPLYHSPPVTKYILPPAHLPSENFWTSIMIWIYCKPEKQEFRLGPRVIVIWFSFLPHCPITLLKFNLVGCRKLRWQKYPRRLPHPDSNISTAKAHFIKSDTHNILPSVSNETATAFLLTHAPHFPLSGMPDLHKVFISCLTQQPPSAFLLCWSLLPAFPWGFFTLKHSLLSLPTRPAQQCCPGLGLQWAEANSLPWS